MSWRVAVPFKGAPRSKSRLGERFDDDARHALALAFLEDTIAAIRRTPDVSAVALVSNEPGLAALFPPEPTLAEVEVVPDPGGGLSDAVAHGIRAARAADPGAHVAVLLGDLPELTADELGGALAAAARHPFSFVTDAAGTGTTMIALAPGVAAEPRFGAGSAAAHASAGFAPLVIPSSSGLRRDVDEPADIDRLVAPGPRTRAVLAAREPLTSGAACSSRPPA